MLRSAEAHGTTKTDILHDARMENFQNYILTLFVVISCLSQSIDRCSQQSMRTRRSRLGANNKSELKMNNYARNTQNVTPLASELRALFLHL